MNPLIIAGTRPEWIKMAPVIFEMRRQGIDPRLIHTGQHDELALDAMAAFDIQPLENWRIMQYSQSPLDVARLVTERMEGALRFYKPDVVIVQGDTSSAMAAALCSFYAGYDVAHVEAGLRTWDVRSPFPEEANRIIIDSVSKFLFAPTSRSARNIGRRAWDDEFPVYITGNTGIDAARLALEMKPTVSYDEPSYSGRRNWPLCIVTTHRRENDIHLPRFVRLLADEVQGLELRVLYAIHPRIRDVVMANMPEEAMIVLATAGETKGLEYVNFIHALNSAAFILTDSGGIQEEAAYMGVPCYVLRDSTERVEGEDIGYARTVLMDEKSELHQAIHEEHKRLAPSHVYGSGHAAEDIVAILKDAYN